MTDDRQYDVVIIGGGPAGLAAGVYAARGRRKTVLLEKGVIGGQIALTELVENYPGIKSINGFDLAQEMLQQAESYGMETAYVDVTGIEQAADHDGVPLPRGAVERGRAVMTPDPDEWLILGEQLDDRSRIALLCRLDDRSPGFGVHHTRIARPPRAEVPAATDRWVKVLP